MERLSAVRVPGGAFVPPTSDDLIAAVLAGGEAVQRHRACFRAVDPADAVPRLFVQALDPLLLSVVLGPDLAAEWVPPLERYYADARRESPASFLDFDRAWDLQRRRWQPLVDAEGAGASLDLAPDPDPDDPGAAGRAAPSRGHRSVSRRLPGAPPEADPLDPAAAAPAPALPAGVPAPRPEDLIGGADAGAAPDGSPPPAAPLPAKPRAGPYGLAVVEAARRRDFDLVTVFDGCLSQLDDVEPHWESFRFGAASLVRDAARPR